jgi:hypothetical protein
MSIKGIGLITESALLPADGLDMSQMRVTSLSGSNVRFQVDDKDRSLVCTRNIGHVLNRRSCRASGLDNIDY